MDNRFIIEVVRLLRDAPPDQRQQLMWDVYYKLVEFMRLSPSPSARNIPFSWQCPNPQTDLALSRPANRYWHDFEDEKELGRGGFGRVVMAKNKLDGHSYAIKMIITEDMGELSPETCAQEVRTLAELNHRHVVRYYTAWVEDEVWQQRSHWTSATVEEWFGSDTSHDTNEDSSSENSMPPQPYANGTSSDDGIVFQNTGEREVDVQPPSLASQSIPQHPRQTHSNTPSRESAGVGRAVLPFRSWIPPLPKKVLYIQMGLCGESLRKWMDDRNANGSPVVVEKCLRIFRQLLEALSYIHQEGYMHRDVKPANIFFTLDGDDIKLGDFGLARLIAHPPTPTPAAPNTTSLTPLAPQNYTRDVGTPLYTAPEVKRGKYGQESDMYSLGIILLELFMPFKTSAERSIAISRLKDSGDLDPDLRCDWPCIKCWIKSLTDKDPANRPSAKELLESPLFPQPIPPPSLTTPTIIEDTSAGALSRLTITDTSQALESGATSVEFIQSKYTSVTTLEINKVTTERSVNNCTVRIEEQLSKDEEIAVLTEENVALKRQVAVLERQLEMERRKNCKASQAAEN